MVDLAFHRYYNNLRTKMHDIFYANNSLHKRIVCVGYEIMFYDSKTICSIKDVRIHKKRVIPLNASLSGKAHLLQLLFLLCRMI